MDQGVLETIKRRYKRDLLLRLLNEENEGLNIAQFTKTLNILDAVLMSAKSWSEVEESTIAECEALDTSLQIDIDTLDKNDPSIVLWLIVYCIALASIVVVHSYIYIVVMSHWM